MWLIKCNILQWERHGKYKIWEDGKVGWHIILQYFQNNLVEISKGSWVKNSRTQRRVTMWKYNLVKHQWYYLERRERHYTWEQQPQCSITGQLWFFINRNGSLATVGHLSPGLQNPSAPSLLSSEFFECFSHSLSILLFPKF